MSAPHFQLGTEVTLKSSEIYDKRTVITPSDIGEVTDVVETGGRMMHVVSFQDITDIEGVTPQLWLTAKQFVAPSNVVTFSDK